MNSLLVAGLLCGVLGAGGGPGSQGPILRTGWNPCDADHCDPCCNCGPCHPGILARLFPPPYAEMGCGPCDDGCDPCCNPCSTPCCGLRHGARPCHDRTYYGPLTFVFSIFGANTWCGSGCGERYWGDFRSCPPDCCDPCDGCGNYIGGPGRGSCCGSDYGGVRAAPRYANPGAESEMTPLPNPQDRTISPVPQPGERIPHPAKPIPKTTRRPNYYPYRYR
jgi:hypothetical protein